MDYLVLSRDACEKYCKCKHKLTSVIISIRSSWDKILPTLPMTEDNKVKDVIYLSFCDIEESDCLIHRSSKGIITAEDAKKIADFVNSNYDKVERLIVHCDGGISRSAGVCSAIMRWYEDDDSKYFRSKSKFPNITCYLKVLDAFRGIEDNTHISRWSKYLKDI